MKLSAVARAILAIACVASATQPTQAETPGVAGSVSTAGVQYLLDTLVPVLRSKLSSLHMDGTSGRQSGFDYSLGNINCAQFAIGSATASSSSSAGANVNINGLGVSCSASWSFKLHSWPHLPKGSGHVDISISGASVNLGVLVTSTPDGHAQMTPENINLNLGDVHLSFHGSLWDWLINIFKGFITRTVKSGVSSAFTSVLTDFIRTDLNKLLLNVPLTLPLHVSAPYNIAAIRFGLTQNPTFTAQYMGAALQGDIVPIANPVAPPLTPSTIPPFNAASGSRYLQMHMSSYTALSAVYTYYHAGLMHRAVDSSSIPLGLNNTRGFALIAPGFASAYPNHAVSLNLVASSMPAIGISPSGVNITLPVNIEFIVEGANTVAFTLQAVTQLDAAVHVGPDSSGTLAISAVLQYLSSHISVVSSNVGSVNAGLLQSMVNFVFTNVAVPTFNLIFANGIPLPTVAGLGLTNTAIQYNNGYVTFASDFTFNPMFALTVQPRAYHINNAGTLRTTLPMNAPAA